LIHIYALACDNRISWCGCYVCFFQVYFDIAIAGRPAGRVVVGLFGQDAPQSVDSFVKICNGKLRGRGSRTASYAYSIAWRILKDERIDLGRVKQVDEINQSPGKPQRQLVLIAVPENSDTNDLEHSVPGTVSVRKGGGEFEFTITPSAQTNASGARLNSENIVIGRVLEGMDIIDAMNSVPTNQKTVRDGFRNIGKAIGDGRAKLDVRIANLPTRIALVSRMRCLETLRKIVFAQDAWPV
jgi:cyclophilin family peptidyl-prolyl cis-trans isomerase